MPSSPFPTPKLVRLATIALTGLDRMRLLALALVLTTLAHALVMLPKTDGSTVGGIAAALAVAGLAAYWIRGFRRGGFALAGEPVEIVAAFLILRAVPGDPFLPLFALLFRSLYGPFGLAFARYVGWTLALLLGHLPRGEAQITADIARVLGLAVAPVVLQTLRWALEATERSERRLRSLVQNSTDVTTVLDAQLVVRWQAASIRDALGLDPQELLGHSFRELVHPDDRALLDDYQASSAGRPDHRQRLPLRLAHGHSGYRHFEVIATNRLHDASVAGHVLNMRDATGQHDLEQELRALAAQREHDALHDPLTGLANRRQLFSRLGSMTSAASLRSDSFTLLLIDLDQFKELNDTLGHHAGDRLLGQIGPRLSEALPEAELIARIGGDEFAVVLGLGSDTAAGESAATRVEAALASPFVIDGITLLIRASVGIAVYPDHARSVQTLVQRADVAMYSAKRRGLGQDVYSHERDAHSRERLALLGALPGALAAHQILVHYQPKVDLEDGAIVGVEALVRWRHPEKGLLGPGAFVPLAEQSAIMRGLTHYVLDDALGQCARWAGMGLDLTVAVNLGALNLLDTGLPAEVGALLERHDVSPSRLLLEVTETIIGADPARLSTVMHELRALGVKLSLDDFGTGSSSLGYLRSLPVDELKIDKSFLAGMDEHEQDRAVVQTIIALAHNLGLRVVAEGIETETAHQHLRRLGCDLGQGYLFGRPMPADELALLARGARQLAA